ncbi:MAG: esterase-like activity of phytase family protein [Pseudomonadota bacterium]
MARGLFGARTTRATLVAITIAALIFGIAMLAHSREQNDTTIATVALNESDPERKRVGALVYMGGLDIPPMGQNIGGLSGLRWDAKSGRLLAITDDARWVWMSPTEDDQQLTGLAGVEVGPMYGVDGKVLTSKEQGDSESLTRFLSGGWMIGFERDHRIWRYDDQAQAAQLSGLDPVEFLGALEANQGLETMAANDRVQILCAERQAVPDQANCVRSRNGEDAEDFPVKPPVSIDRLGGVPTDADMLADGTALILFRSWSRGDGNGAAIVAYAPDGTRRELMTLRPPLTVDNFEGLAVREEGKRTFLYIVSDDNFSSNQRTLLMKFEVLPEAE